MLISSKVFPPFHILENDRELIVLLFSVAADFLSDVYKYHLMNDDNDADWNRMFNYYKITTSTQERTRALVAISSTSNKDRLNK